jgi:poly(hydroxyalkanoate) granule-associated protein
MSKTQELQKEIKKTTDEATARVKTTVDSVQKELTETAGDVKDAVQSVFLAGLGALSVAEEEGSKLFKKLVKKGQKVNLPGLGTERVESLRKQFDGASDKAADAVKGRVNDAKYVAGETADKIEDRVQDAVAAVMKRIGVPTREEIAELTSSVERLTARVEALQTERASASAGPALASVGGGWYEITVGGTVVEKVQGREEAEAALARLI